MTKRAFVIGDLHLGAGFGDPLEDFLDDRPFADFCDKVADNETTLVLNGDIVDFAQIAPFEMAKESFLLWTERASREKLEVALKGHPDFFAGLRRFVMRGGRIVYVVGNPDLDVVWPSVQQRLREVLKADDRSLCYALESVRYAGVHIEHGFQFTPENCPQDPKHFVHTGADGKRYLERVWGTDFMLAFYNDIERHFPYADNVKPTLALVWHGLRNGWIGGGELLRVLLFLKHRGLPWRGIASAVLEGGEGPLEPAAVAASFEDPAWQALVADRVSDPRFMEEVTRAYAALESRERARVRSADAIKPEPSMLDAHPDAATLGLFRPPREERAARERLTEGVTAVVFGHTHELVDGALDGALFNYGTWLPVLDLRSPKVRSMISAHGVTKEMLGDRSLYRVERRVVRIDPIPQHRSQVRLAMAEEPFA